MPASGGPAALPALCVALIAGLDWRAGPLQPGPVPRSEALVWLDGDADAGVEAWLTAPTPTGEEWCADLPRGALARVSYDDDVRDLERVVVWPSRRGEAVERVGLHFYWVLSPDGNWWRELLSGASPTDGPSDDERIADGGVPPADGRKLCSFRERPTPTRLVEPADGCRLAMEARGQAAAGGPAHVELASGMLLEGGEVSPWAAPPWPSHRLHGRQGHVWVLTEPVFDLDIGTLADPSNETLIGAGLGAPRLRRGRAFRRELVPRDGGAGRASRRVAELGRLLEVAVPVATLGSSPPGGVLDGAAASGAEGAPARDGAPSADALADAARDGTRTFWIEWDGQGERYKGFREAADESADCVEGHQRQEDGLTRLHTCKMMYHTMGTPRSWLGKFLNDKYVVHADRVAPGPWPPMEVLEEAVSFDQANLGGLALLVVAERRLNVTVDAYKCAGTPSFASAKYLSPLGESDESTAPPPRSHVAYRMKEACGVEQSVMKAEAADARVTPHPGAPPAGPVMTEKAQPGEWAPPGWYHNLARASPLPPSDFERDLFPVPMMAAPGGSARGRRSQHRTRARQREVELVNRALRSLNWLAGFKGAAASPSPGATTLDKHAALQQHLLREAHRRQAAAPQVTPRAEAALRELLRGQSVYETDLAPRNLVSYLPGKVSLPDSVLDCRFIEDIVSPGCRSFLEENHKRMRLEPESVNFDSMPRLYMDPVLKRNPKSYRAQLLSSEGFGRIEIELPPGVLPSSAEGQRLLDAFAVYVATTDVKDCFYRMRVREDLGRYFCLPAVPKYVFDGLQVAGVPAETPPDAPVRPYLAVLPTGFTWSLYLAQAANEDRVCRSPSLCKAMPAGRQQPLIQDQAEAFVLRAASRGVGGAYVHVDNLGAVSDDADLSERMPVGLALHKSESHGGAGEALGTELDGVRLRSGITSSRFWKLERGLTGLLARGRCSGQALEKVIGHCTFCGLAARESLSIFHTVYKFISVQYLDVGPMWPEVVEELVAFRGALLLLGRDWWLPWNPCVLETDASLAGWAMAQSFWGPAQVAGVGRVSERTRFKRVGAHSARESALTSAHLFRDESGEWRSQLLGDDPLSDDWEVVAGFPEVPWQLLRGPAWKTVRKGVWGLSEGILVLEARVLVKAIRRLARTMHGSCFRQLFLCDNTAVVLAFARSRSQDFKLLVQIRRFNACALALGIAPYFRWIPSEFNQSDAGSRDHSESVPTDVGSDAAADVGPSAADLSRTASCSAETWRSPAALPECSAGGEGEGECADGTPESDGGTWPQSPPRRADGGPRRPTGPDMLGAPPLPAADDLAPAASAGDDEAGAEGEGESNGPDNVVNHATAASRRSRRLQDSRHQRQAALHTDMFMQARLVVTRRARERYANYLDRSYSHADPTNDKLMRGTNEAVDCWACDYFNAMYLSEEQSGLEDQTGTALVDRRPASDQRGRGAPPRTWRALEAWRRRAPPRTRRALPFAVQSPGVWLLADKGLPLMALFLAVGLSACSRSSSLVAALRCALVPPPRATVGSWNLPTHPEEEGRPSRTNRYNEERLPDSSYFQGAGPLLPEPEVSGDRPMLWPFAYLELSEAVQLAAAEDGVDRLTLYHLRRSGASIDASRLSRTLEEMRMRTWQSLVPS
ncbi:unnamed protein product [Prorocentrum cordatum]|uniref:Uncharacterized protein n=1 Tax=Prorocentrum cordatum TaxID=2364126 RepID=A0ABN9W7Y7_9DINO|nr:unnamed protein product [Polarella glacialis]